MASPFGPTIKIFYRRLHMKMVHFLPFSSKFQKKWANLRLPLNVQKQKVFQLQGGASPPDPPTRGSAPGPRWWIRPQTSVIGSCSARSPWPTPLPNPKYATGVDQRPMNSPCLSDGQFVKKQIVSVK